MDPNGNFSLEIDHQPVEIGYLIFRHTIFVCHDQHHCGGVTHSFFGFPWDGGLYPTCAMF